MRNYLILILILILLLLALPAFAQFDGWPYGGGTIHSVGDSLATRAEVASAVGTAITALPALAQNGYKADSARQVFICTPTGANNTWTITQAFSYISPGSVIKLTRGTYLDSNLTTTIAPLRIEGMGMGFTIWKPRNDTCFVQGNDSITLATLTLQSSNKFGSVWNSANFGYTLDHVQVVAESLWNMGTAITSAYDCQFDIKNGGGQELRGTHSFWRCNWGYRADSTNYYGAEHLSGNSYLYQCQGWGASYGFHMPGTPGVASSVSMWDCHFKAYGSTNYCVGLNQLEQLYTYGGFFRNSSTTGYTIYAHDSSAVHLFNPTLKNDGASNNLTVYLGTQGASEIWNGEYYGGGIKLDTCDDAGSTDGLCNFNGFFASNAVTPLNDKYNLARFSGDYARTADIYGTSFMAYVKMFPDSTAIAANKTWHGVTLCDTAGVAAGPLGYLGWNSATSSMSDGWNITRLNSGNLLRIMQGAKLQAYNGTAYVDVLTTNGASGVKITVTTDTLNYGSTWLPPR